jgi:hypothetical protein
MGKRDRQAVCPAFLDESSAIFRPSEIAFSAQKSLSQYIGGKPIFWMRER